MGFFVLGNPKQRQVSTTRNLMDTDCFHKVNLMDTACFYQGNPMNTCMQDTTKMKSVNVSSHLPAMLVPIHAGHQPII